MILIEHGEQVARERWQFDPEFSIAYEDFKAKPLANATVTISPDDIYEDITEFSHLIQVIIIPFESFADGRVFSVARQLRHAYGYDKTIIASGPMIIAQYGFALQCGIDGLLIPDELFERQPIELWQQALDIHPIKHDAYQSSSSEDSANEFGTTEHLATLNNQFRTKDAEALLQYVVNEPKFGRTAVVSSFGAESAILLHLVAKVDPSLPVIFIDTEKHFSETIDYRDTLTQYLGLTNVITIKPRQTILNERDANGLLHMTDTTACCYIRKVLPLEEALAGFDTWISGRKFYQTESRKNLPLFEQSGDHLKVNPLIHWQQRALEDYMHEHNLPQHPLVKDGYTSIGCHHCTTPTSNGEDLRAGRWRSEDKTECGIHFIDGQVQRDEKSQPVTKAITHKESLNKELEEEIIWTNWAF